MLVILPLKLLVKLQTTSILPIPVDISLSSFYLATQVQLV